MNLTRNDMYALVLLGANVFVYSLIMPTLKFVVFRYVPVISTNTTIFVSLYSLLLFIFFFNMFRFSGVFQAKDEDKPPLIISLFFSTIALFIVNTLIEILVSRFG